MWDGGVKKKKKKKKRKKKKKESRNNQFNKRRSAFIQNIFGDIIHKWSTVLKLYPFHLFKSNPNTSHWAYD